MKLLVFGHPQLKADQIGFEKMMAKGREAGWEIDRRTSTGRDDVAAMAIYDIVNTPAIIILREDGQPVQMWQYRIPSYEEIVNRYI